MPPSTTEQAQSITNFKINDIIAELNNKHIGNFIIIKNTCSDIHFLINLLNNTEDDLYKFLKDNIYSQLLQQINLGANIYSLAVRVDLTEELINSAELINLINIKHKLIPNKLYKVFINNNDLNLFRIEF